MPPTPMPPGTRAVVAAFDVDGTLTTGDCVTAFLRRAAGRRLLTSLLAHAPSVAGAVVRRDRDRLKELACSTLAGLDANAVDELGASFAREVCSKRLREDTAGRLRRHRELGHVVILASASLDAYLVPLGELLEVDAVVCTRLERGDDGRLTGRLVGANCRGPEKARRVQEWLGKTGLAGAELWAYGDSDGDTQLLALADRPHRVDGLRLDPEPR